MRIIAARSQQLPAVKVLFREYQQWLNIDLCFQDFETELNSLPGSYAPPSGALFLAIEGGEPVGCVAVRPLAVTKTDTGKTEADKVAELKRLYVRPVCRGQGIGKELFLNAMEATKRIGYTSIVLDTLPMMRAAKSMYIAYGFSEIPAYYPNPVEGVQYYRYVF